MNVTVVVAFTPTLNRLFDSSLLESVHVMHFPNVFATGFYTLHVQIDNIVSRYLYDSRVTCGYGALCVCVCVCARVCARAAGAPYQHPGNRLDKNILACYCKHDNLSLKTTKS